MGVLIVVDGYALLRDWINKNRPNKQMKIKLPSRNMGKNHKLIQSLREENNKLKDLLAEILEDGGFRNFEVQERCRQILDSETK